MRSSPRTRPGRCSSWALVALAASVVAVGLGSRYARRSVAPAGPAVGREHGAEPTQAASHDLSPAVCEITGRCLALEDQTPLPDCTVALQGWPADDLRVAAFPGRLDWRAPAPVRTDAEGRFVIRCVPLPPLAFDLVIGAPDRVRSTRRWLALAPGSRIDLGPLPLARARPLCGRVVDDAGQPIAGITVTVQHPVAAPDAAHQITARCTAVSGPDGGFAFAEPFPAGSWRLTVAAEGWEAVGPARAEIALTAPEIPATVVVRRVTDCIRGVVVDTDGAAVADQLVTAWLDSLGAPVGQTRTAADGSFQLHRSHAARTAPRLRTPGRPQSHGTDGRMGCDPWGSAGIRLVVARLATLDLAVVEADTGRPVERFRVAGAGSSGGHHPGGRVRLTGLPPGERTLVVYPGAADLVHSAPIPVDPSRATGPLQVELAASRRVALLITGNDGTPAAGSEVELVELFGGAFTASTTAMATALTDDGSFLGALLLERGTTDAQGRLTLHAPPVAFDYRSLLPWECGPRFVVRARGAQHQTTLARLPDSLGDVAVTVTVAPGATLSGTVTPHDLATHLAFGIILRRTDLTADQSGWQHPYQEIGRDGSYVVPGLPPATWAVHLAWRPEGQTPIVQPVPLAQVDLGADQRRELRLDATGLAPGPLRGQLRLDGQPLAATTFQLLLGCRSPKGIAPDRIVLDRIVPGATTDAGGHFVVPALPPGLYRARVPWRAPDGTVVGLLPEGWVECPANRQQVVDWELTTRRVRLRLLGPGDRPLADAGIVVQGAGGCFSRWSATDAEGWLDLAGAPAGSLDLTLTNPAATYRGFAPEELRAGLRWHLDLAAPTREHCEPLRPTAPATPPR